MQQITLMFNEGGFNRFSLPAIPCVGEQIAVVHGDGSEEVFVVTQVRHRGYRSGIDEEPYTHESAAMVWGDLVDLKGHSPFTS